MRNKNKKIIISLIVVIVLLIIVISTETGIGLYIIVDQKQEIRDLKNQINNYSHYTIENKEEMDSNYNTSNFKEIKATDVAKESKKEAIVVLMGRQGCGYCAAFVPILEEVQSEYDITIRYIDLAEIIDIETGNVIDQMAYDTWINLKGEGFESITYDNFGSTPQLYVIKDNKIINGIVGYTEKNSVKDFLKDAGIKK